MIIRIQVSLQVHINEKRREVFIKDGHYERSQIFTTIRQRNTPKALMANAREAKMTKKKNSTCNKEDN